tara:strand:- start:7432 stop:7740 length:309 start_codon:yes stop_codon:yes gene_type:complete
MNAFFSNNNNQTYDSSININCENIKYLESNYNELNRDKLNTAINCSANNTRSIRNVDDERPMMFPEYRYTYLNYCTLKSLDGYVVCKDCKRCSYNKNVKVVP